MPSENELQKSIASIWREVLDVDSIGVRDNFFDLGGTSRLMVQVGGRLKEALGQELSVLELFKFPTISALANHLSRQGAMPALSGGVERSAEPPASRKGQLELQREKRTRAREDGPRGDDDR